MKYTNQEMFDVLPQSAQTIINNELVNAELLYPIQVKIGEGFEPNANRDAHMRVYGKGLESKMSSIKLTLERSKKSSIQADSDKASMALELAKQQSSLWRQVAEFVSIEFARPVKVETNDKWSISA